MPDPSLPARLLTHCRQYTSQRIDRLRTALADIQQSREADTKSSAGDKFETGRERLQAEEDKLSAQLGRVLRDREVLSLLERPLASTDGTARLGSPVRTDGGNFYLSIAAGKTEIDGETWFCVSMDSPAGRVLGGSMPGDVAILNGRELRILSA